MFPPTIKRLSAVAATLALIAGMGGASPTNAYESPLDLNTSDLDKSQLQQLQEKELNAFFEEARIPADTQEKLLEKLNNGELWDSMKGSEAISAEEVNEHGFSKTIYRFEDGSAVITSVQNPLQTINANTDLQNGVSECQVASSSHYHISHYDCLAKVSMGVASLSFRFDRTTGSGAQATLDGYRSPAHFIVGGSITNGRFQKVSNHQVRYYVEYVSESNELPAQGTMGIDLKLGLGTDATVDWVST